MTEDQLKKKIAIELQQQNLHDLKAVMELPQGRRFFQWLVMRCGQDNISFSPDGQTEFKEGMRNVALLLKGCMKELGLDGVDLVHKAEREYLLFQLKLRETILEKERGDKK